MNDEEPKTPSLAEQLSQWAAQQNDASPIKPDEEPPGEASPRPAQGRRKKKRRR